MVVVESAMLLAGPVPTVSEFTSKVLGLFLLSVTSTRKALMYSFALAICQFAKIAEWA